MPWLLITEAGYVCGLVSYTKMSSFGVFPFFSFHCVEFQLVAAFPFLFFLSVKEERGGKKRRKKRKRKNSTMILSRDGNSVVCINHC
jgi:hypothetical protein